MPRVKQLKKKQKNYEVTFVDQTKTTSIFTVSEDLVVTFRLVRDKELDPESYRLFVTESEIDKVFQKLKRYALINLRSWKEIDHYLDSHEPDLSRRELIKAKIEKENLVDENKTVREQVLYHAQVKRHGPRKIAWELRLRGFPETLIQDAIASYPAAQYDDNLEHLFLKRLEKLKNMSVNAARNNIINFLQGKGYDLESIRILLVRHDKDISRMVDNQKEIEREYSAILKRLDRTGVPEERKKSLIIASLLRKGYPYELITRILERRK